MSEDSRFRPPEDPEPYDDVAGSPAAGSGPYDAGHAPDESNGPTAPRRHVPYGGAAGPEDHRSGPDSRQAYGSDGDGQQAYGTGATQQVPAQGSGPVPPGATTPPSSYSPQSGSPGAAPSYAPSYGGGGGDDGYGGGYPPSYDAGGGRGSGGGMFPWLAVILGLVVVAAAAFAIWFFALRDSDEETSNPPPDESTSDETPSGETSSGTEETSPAEPESENESESESESESGSDGTDPESPTDGGSESPSDDSSPGDGIQLEIGESYELSNGVTITLEEVDTDDTCPAAFGQDIATATFTMEVPADASPADAPIGGLTLSTSEGPIDMFAGIGCHGSDEALPPVVMPGSEETGLVIIPAPTSGAYDLEYTPLLSGLTGGGSDTLRWTIEP
jgi:hypothetical protein